MKKLAVWIASAMMATASFAYLNVTWDAYGFFNNDGTKVASEGASQIVWQLVYTEKADLTPTYEYKDGAPFSESETTVLSVRTWNEGDATMSVKDNSAYPGSNVNSLTFESDPTYGSYVYGENMGDTDYLNEAFTKSSVEGVVCGIYAAIFRYGTDGSIYYAVTPVNKNIGWAKTDPPSPSDGVNFGDMAAPTNIDQCIKAAVPEPATMSLLGLGALAMVIRRKLRK